MTCLPHSLLPSALATALLLTGLDSGCGLRSPLEAPASAHNGAGGGAAQPGGSGGRSGGSVTCGGTVCDHPPAPACPSLGKRRTYDLPALCERDTCLYATRDTDCTWGCLDGQCNPPAYEPVAAGGGHACALDRARGVKCWGANRHGQLGNGSTTDSAVPVASVGLGGDFIAVTAGAEHTCTLDSTATVRCWGANADMQLGNNGTSDSDVPVAVDTSEMSSGAVRLSAGTRHTCALTARTPPKCWGLWTQWDVGQGYLESSSSFPSGTDFPAGTISIAAGNLYTCAVTPAHGVKCFGWNPRGQLGIGSTANVTTPPANVKGLDAGVRSVAAGFAHTCAVTDGGGLKCWGANPNGQLGTGNTADTYVPAEVTGLSSGVAAVAAGTSSTCALMQNRGVKCWGGNEFGQLGNGSTTASETAVEVSGLGSGVLAVTVGDGFACAAHEGGAVKCWGRNDHGQLGNGSTLAQSRPVDVQGL